jgi:Rieske 2Fe-2S family protein
MSDEAQASTARSLPYGKERPALQPGALTLPARHYTDPGLFQQELERIHFDMWLWAGRAEQLATPGSYLVVEVGSASVLILRGEGGALGAFHNVCRHRGTLLCSGDEGQLPGRLQCRYHGWTYALDGRLVGAPHMDRVEGFRESDYSLGKVAVAEWDGHVFINLKADPPPLSEHLAGLDVKFRPWRMQELKRVERRVYHVKANWKLVIQNYSECLHCPLAHPLLHRLSHYMSGDNEPPRPTYLGGRMELRPEFQTLSLDGSSNRPSLPGLSADEARHVYYYALLPNLLLNLHPDYMLTFAIWPRAVDRSDVICEWYFHPNAIASPAFDPRGAIDFWDMTNRQDWELSDLAQSGISSRGYRPGPYSNREELLLAFDRFVLDRLGMAADPAGG